jgi:hypothetical protein
VDHFIAMEASEDIALFRKRALCMATTELERRFIQNQLHEPTLRLRKQIRPWSGIDIAQAPSNTIWNETKFWEHLTADLIELRRNGTATTRSNAASTTSIHVVHTSTNAN